MRIFSAGAAFRKKELGCRNQKITGLPRDEFEIYEISKAEFDAVRSHLMITLVLSEETRKRNPAFKKVDELHTVLGLPLPSSQ